MGAGGNSRRERGAESGEPGRRRVGVRGPRPGVGCAKLRMIGKLIMLTQSVITGRIHNIPGAGYEGDGGGGHEDHGTGSGRGRGLGLGPSLASSRNANCELRIASRELRELFHT